MSRRATDPVLEGYMRDMSLRFHGKRGLSAGEETDLARRAVHGDAAAQARLVETHLVFVFEIAKEYSISAKKMDFLDLVQEGNRGLMQAAETFRPGMGRFAQYAARSVKWRILQELRRDRKNDNHETSFIENCQEPVAQLEDIQEREAAAVLLSRLLGYMSERGRIMVIMRFGLRDGVALSVTEIARRLGVDRSDVSHMINRAFRHARERHAAAMQAAP